jgi:hypothetical protein
MKRYCSVVRWLAASLLALLITRPAQAQTRRAAGVYPARAGAATEARAVPRAPGEALRIRKLEGLGKQYQFRTPDFRTSMGGGMKRPGEWAEIKLTFDTFDEWIDELVVQYYVLTLSKETGKTLYSFYKTTARYVDVEQGNGHLVAAYLPPHAVKRFGAPVAIAVEMAIGEKIVAVAEESDSSPKPPPQWWKDQKVMGDERLTTRDFLQTRRQTPFWLVATDDYEAER